MEDFIHYIEYWSLRAFGFFAALYAVFGVDLARHIAMVAFAVLVWCISVEEVYIILEAVLEAVRRKLNK